MTDKTADGSIEDPRTAMEGEMFEYRQKELRSLCAKSKYLYADRKSELVYLCDLFPSSFFF